MVPQRSGQAVIDDGYTRPAFIQGVAFTTPAVRFSYRPPLVKDLAVIRRELAKASAEAVVSIQAKSICRYVTDWDVKGVDNKTVPLKPESLMNVDPIIFDGVSGIVLGLRFTEIDPEWTKDESDTESQRSLDTIFGGDVTKAEETDVKN